MEISRRSVLIGLAASTPLASTLISSLAHSSDVSEESPLLKVSRVIVGRADLDPKISLRIYAALSEKIDDFDSKLGALADDLSADHERDAALSALDDDKLDLALAIAQPWYTGVVGVGKEHAFDDDAVFITFLGAQALRSVQHALPIQSYSTGAPGWWAEPPSGVTPPPMPQQVRDWTYVPSGATGPMAKPDPDFLQLVNAKSAGYS